AVPDHRLRVVGSHDDQVDAAEALGERRQFDVARLGHRSRVEGGDLVVVPVGGAHEPGGVPHLGDVHPGRVDTVAFQPGGVVGEVRADRADQDRVQSETAQAEADVGGDPSPAYFQFVDEEGQGDLGELVGDELDRKSTRLNSSHVKISYAVFCLKKKK